MKPIAILLHGGGLSAWALKPLADVLSSEYQVVTPIIEGHGEKSNADFISIHQSAKSIVRLIANEYGGQVKLLYGLSLGAQIVCECLALDSGITEYAIIESALAKPNPFMASLMSLSYKMFFGLIKNRRFSAAQSKALYIPAEMFEQYYHDSCRMSKNTLINIGKSNMSFSLNPQISNTIAKTLIVYGSKEIKSIKLSAGLLKELIKDSEIYIAEGYNHGEFSIRYAERCGKVYMDFCN